MELLGNDRERVLCLLKNTQHELTVLTVIGNKSPGKVYVDNKDYPRSFFIKTPECNMVGGDCSNASFNIEIRTVIDYYDSITCDSEEWEKAIQSIHPNSALRSFKRKYLSQTKKTELYKTSDSVRQEYVYHDDLHRVQYKNKELVLNWINILDTASIRKIPLAAIIISEGEIVSCSALDCIDNDAVEIGIKTRNDYRRKGYAAFAVSSLIKKLNENEIMNIGWHCMATNAGSISTAIKCGFSEKISYSTFYPFPPIENDTDLDSDGWFDLGTYYEKKGDVSVDQCWQAARCFVHSGSDEKVLSCVNRLIEEKQYWFLKELKESIEFERLRSNETWNSLIKSVEGKNT